MSNELEFDEVGDVLHRATTGKTGRDAFTALATAYRDHSHQHPSRDEAVDAARYVRSTLHGFVGLELAGGFEIPRSFEHGFDRLTDAARAAAVAVRSR
ncbi:hypothetical protein SAMN04487904_102357 [Actinopolyspora lacussalsi subsp. righensis]|uniref:HTH-type transcriptional regulator MT1864/Rv1816-like C-terminal domain-containing protein n=1 Tax=Actinopolyspora righensis TaxID=995060 RepID=A0A1I6YAT1_9ACTN|nr:TetR-like C-terminal domain-containing protein [Actinopolyspora righensis]SFT47522.1 hypothetical protein SAMN04487904_102357 [Actinopolyspora righensis]